MTFIDRTLLFLTIIVAAFTLRKLFGDVRLSRSERGAHMLAQGVVLIASALLSVFGWGILGLMGSGVSNKLVAIVSSLIPFSWASAVLIHYRPQLQKPFILLMGVGLLLITMNRFGELEGLARMVYPVFHSIAGATVIASPVLAVRNKMAQPGYIWVSVGGSLISAGGISLAFLSAGKQLLFLSQELVLTIMAPLLFFMTLTYSFGLITGRMAED